MFQKKSPDLVVAFVDCPYCDGENVITKTGLHPSRREFPDREIACLHCSSLFLLSETEKGVRTRLIEESDTASVGSSGTRNLDQSASHSKLSLDSFCRKIAITLKTPRGKGAPQR